MKTKLFNLAFAITLLMACESKKQDPYSFDTFVSSFPEKEGDVHLFNLGVQYMPTDTVQLDTLQLSLYLPIELLNDLPLAPISAKPIYAVAKLNIKSGITSLVYAQPEGDFNSESIFLVNYDATGKLLNAQALAYDFGGGSTYYQLESRLDKGVFKFKETEGQRRPEEGQEPLVKEFLLELTDDGQFKPTQVSPRVLGTFTEVQQNGSEWIRFETCNGNINDFEITTDGPFAFLNGKLNGEPFSFVVKAIKQSGYDFYLTLKPAENPEEEQIEISILNQENREGLVKIENRYSDLFKNVLFINQAEREQTIIVKEEGCNPPLELITEKGVAGITFGMSIDKLGEVPGLRRTTQQEHDEMEGAMVTFYNMEHPQSDSVYMRVDHDGDVKYVERIYVYSPKYKTDRGIGVGSTLEEINNNYEGLNIISGDIGLIVYTSSFENIGFILDDANYSAPDQEVLIKDVPQGLKVRIVYMYKISQYD